MWTINFAVVFIFVVVVESRVRLPALKTCYRDSECGADHCCAKRIGPLIMSRDIHTTPDPATVKGTCKPYLQQKEWCGGIWRQNGECGCAPQLTCHWYPPTASTLIGLGKRKMAAGDYLCEPKD